MSTDLPKPGDWVSFYRGGVIVYAKVEYPERIKVGGNADVCTTSGIVALDQILEVRRGGL